jgi:hypothetical protein
VVLDQPVDAVEGAAFLVGRERQDHIAIGREPFLLEADEICDELGGHRLVVARAAAVEEAVLLEERERVERPVFALGFDDVEMRQQENRLAARAGASAPSQDEVALLRVRSEHLDIGSGEARGFEPCRHRLGGLGDVACRRVGRVDLDELLVDLACPRIVRPGLRLKRNRRRHQQ